MASICLLGVSVHWILDPASATRATFNLYPPRWAPMGALVVTVLATAVPLTRLHLPYALSIVLALLMGGAYGLGVSIIALEDLTSPQSGGQAGIGAALALATVGLVMVNGHLLAPHASKDY